MMKAHDVGRELGAIAAGQGQRLGQLLANVAMWKVREVRPQGHCSAAAALAELFHTPDEALLASAKEYARAHALGTSSTT